MRRWQIGREGTSRPPAPYVVETKELTARGRYRLPCCGYWRGDGMKRLLFLILVCSAAVNGQEAQKPASEKGPLSGRWTVTADFNGTPLYFKLQLEQQADKLSGDFDGDK